MSSHTLIHIHHSSVVRSLTIHYSPSTSPLPHLIGEQQAQVLLEAAIPKGFPGGGSDTRQMTFDLWPIHWHIHIHGHRHLTWSPGNCELLWSVSLWKQTVCSHFPCLPNSAFPCRSVEAAALNCLNLWPCGFLSGKRTLRLQPRNSFVDLAFSNFITLTLC